MSGFIPYGRQEIDQADIDAVTAVLQSDFLTTGPAVPRFEQAVMERTGAAHAVAVNSATSALHIACLALEIGPGDMVWTVPNTFVASANCALYCGADVDFVDTDPNTWNLCTEALARKLETTDRKPKVVIPVAFAGRSCDMAAIQALAREHGFLVLEDASHAIGGTHAGRPVGCGDFADITVFSFHPVKIITSGEGGMAVTRDPELARRMERLRSHGVTREVAEMDGPTEGPWYYQQTMLGLNYRMTDIQAALGTSQITRIEDFVSRRHVLAQRYDALLSDLPLQRPAPDATGDRSALHLYPVVVDPGRRKEIFERLRSRGIGVQVHYIPVHLHPWYKKMGFAPGDFPQAEAYYAGAISLPLFPALSEADQDKVLAELTAAL